MVSYDINSIEEHLLQIVDQDERNPLWFRFYYKPGHPKSEELKEWFEQHDVKYTVFEQNHADGMQDACVQFDNAPDLAVLFKLRFG